MRTKIVGSDCLSCPLRNCTFVPPVVVENSSVVVIGDVPDVSDAHGGKAFSGRHGQQLRRIFGDKFDSVTYTNAVLCVPHNPRQIEPAVAHCKGHLSNLIPEGTDNNGNGNGNGTKILALGQIAKNAVMGSDCKRGVNYSGKVTTWHPSELVRNPELFFEFHDNVKMFSRLAFSDGGDETWDIDYVVDEMPPNGQVVVDIETYSIEDYGIILIGVMPVGGGKAYMIRDNALKVEFIAGLSSGRWRAIYHNAPFDVRVLEFYNLKRDVPFDDTLVMHLMVREIPPHGLEDLARLVFGLDNYKSMLDEWNPKRFGFGNVPLEILMEYNAKDLEVTRRLYLGLSSVLDSSLYRHSIALQRALIRLSANGIPVDHSVLSAAKDTMQDTMNNLVSEINALMYTELELIGVDNITSDSKPIQRILSGGIGINPSSPVQMGWLLYDLLKFPVPKIGRSTGTDAIAEISRNYEHVAKHPVIKWLKEYRRISKLLTGYVNVMSEHEVIHTNFLIHGTEIGRLATRNPTVHGIPRPDDYFGNFIRASVHRAGHKVVAADYSQIELRVAAMLSREPVWVEAFKAGFDVHGQTARDIYGNNYTKAERTYCKNFNFAYLYGGNEYSFASQVNLPLEKAREFVLIYKSKMAVLEDWKRSVEDDALRLGYVENPFGRRRRFPYVNRANEADARKQALHFLVSSTASDICTRALTSLMADTRLNVVATVHDSIIGIEPNDVAVEYAEVYKRVMRETAYFYFPNFYWGVDVDISNRWSPYPVVVNSEQVKLLDLSGRPPYRYDINADNVPEFLSAYRDEDVINLWLL